MAVTYTPYCSLTNLQDRLSDDGVNLRIDDKPTVITAVINRASAKLEGYCRPRYDPTQLVNSAWALEAATSIALRYLCKRRGNPVPASIERDFQELISDDGKSGELQMVRRGSFQIPDIPMRKVDVPVMSNLHPRLDPFPRTTVERNNSTGTPTGYTQNVDRLDLWDYSI